MNPVIKESIIKIIKANLVRKPNNFVLESVVYTEKPVTPVATVNNTPANPALTKSKARTIKSAIRRILGKNQNTPQPEAPKVETVSTPEYTCTKLISMTKEIFSNDTRKYTLSYGNTIFEQHIISDTEEITPAQQDIIDIQNALEEQFKSQIQNGYGPKLSAREMAITKYLEGLQK